MLRTFLTSSLVTAALVLVALSPERAAWINPGYSLIFSKMSSFMPREDVTVQTALAPDLGAVELREQLRKSRQKTIDNLRYYADSGEFPAGVQDQLAISDADPHFDADMERTHRFRGPNGNLCALAFLIHESGDEAIVRDIENHENHFCVGLDHNKAIETWILNSGLTKEECIAIQAPSPDYPERQEERRAEIFAEMDQKRQEILRKHLSSLVLTLQANMEESLDKATERLLATRAQP